MIIGKLNSRTKEWQMGVYITAHPRWRAHRGINPFISFWCLKLTILPDEGSAITKEHHKGFYFEWELFNTFGIPIITVRTLKIGKKYYTIPYKIWFSRW